MPNDNWATPLIVRNHLKKFYKLDEFDPCPIKREPDFDGLLVQWGSKEKEKQGVIFVNCPYSQTEQWVRKAHAESLQGKFIIMLLPANKSDTSYFHDIILKYCDIHYFRGRLSYIDIDKKAKTNTNKAPYGSMLVYFNPLKLINKLTTNISC